MLREVRPPDRTPDRCAPVCDFADLCTKNAPTESGGISGGVSSRSLGPVFDRPEPIGDARDGQGADVIGQGPSGRPTPGHIKPGGCGGVGGTGNSGCWFRNRSWIPPCPLDLLRVVIAGVRPSASMLGRNRPGRVGWPGRVGFRCGLVDGSPRCFGPGGVRRCVICYRC